MQKKLSMFFCCCNKHIQIRIRMINFREKVGKKIGCKTNVSPSVGHFKQVRQLWVFSLFIYRYYAHGEVLEEEVAPVVLDVEEEAKDKAEVHQADEDDHHHPTVYGHLPYHQGCFMCLRRTLLKISPVEILLFYKWVIFKSYQQ